MTNSRARKSIITYTPGRAYKVKLRRKRLKNGIISLFLDYYLGTVKNGTKTIGKRKFKFFDIHIVENPKSQEERQTMNESLALAENIRSRKESSFKHNREGISDPNIKKINFLDFYQNYLKNYSNKDIRLVRYSFEKFKSYINTDYISPLNIDENLVKGFKAFLLNELNGETPLIVYMIL